MNQVYSHTCLFLCDKDVYADFYETGSLMNYCSTGNGLQLKLFRQEFFGRGAF